MPFTTIVGTPASCRLPRQHSIRRRGAPTRNTPPRQADQPLRRGTQGHQSSSLPRAVAGLGYDLHNIIHIIGAVVSDDDYRVLKQHEQSGPADYASPPSELPGDWPPPGALGPRWRRSITAITPRSGAAGMVSFTRPPAIRTAVTCARSGVHCHPPTQIPPPRGPAMPHNYAPCRAQRTSGSAAWCASPRSRRFGDAALATGRDVTHSDAVCPTAWGVGGHVSHVRRLADG
jgi:hypothetical protein